MCSIEEKKMCSIEYKKIEDQINTVFKKLTFSYVHIEFDEPKCKFVFKNSSLKSWLCFC